MVSWSVTRKTAEATSYRGRAIRYLREDTIQPRDGFANSYLRGSPTADFADWASPGRISPTATSQPQCVYSPGLTTFGIHHMPGREIAK